MVKVYTLVALFDDGDFPRLKTISAKKLPKGQRLTKIELVEFNPGTEQKLTLKFNPESVLSGRFVAAGISLDEEHWN